VQEAPYLVPQRRVEQDLRADDVRRQKRRLRRESSDPHEVSAAK